MHISVYLLHVSANHVAILREVRYKGCKHREIVKFVCEQTHISKIFNF